MVNPLFFIDNSPKNIGDLSEIEISALNIIANKTVGELINCNDNLLVYSSNKKDKIEEQTVFNLNSPNQLITTNLVGFIGVNDVKINIGSRFSVVDGKQYFIQYMLQKIHKLNLFDFQTTHDNSNIWEQLLYLIFPIFLKKAYNQGIFKVYQRRQYNDSKLKGRIDIAQHIRQNLPFIGNIAYSNKELSMNNPIIQLIRHTIEFITTKGFSSVFYNDYIINNAVQTIKTITPNYNIKDRQKLLLKNYRRLNHPFFTEYEPLRKLCIQILNYDGLSFNNNQNKVYGLLIDAAWLWEEYLNSILKDLNFTHPENKTGEGVLKLFEKYRDLYPDFYNRERSMVIDAKYKRFKNDEASREDIYQVVTYMYRLKAEYGVLLYPSEFENKPSINKMNIESYGGEGALFIKYGIKVPAETAMYKDYTICFKESEIGLRNYFEYETFKKIKTATTQAIKEWQ